MLHSAASLRTNDDVSIVSPRVDPLSHGPIEFVESTLETKIDAGNLFCLVDEGSAHIEIRRAGATCFFR